MSTKFFTNKENTQQNICTDNLNLVGDYSVIDCPGANIEVTNDNGALFRYFPSLGDHLRSRATSVAKGKVLKCLGAITCPGTNPACSKDGVDKNWYCLGTISRSGYNKISFNLGNMKKKVRPHLLDYYKTNHPKKILFNSQDLDTHQGRLNFCEKLNMVLPSYHPQIREHIRKNPKMKSLQKSIDFFFPL